MPAKPQCGMPSLALLASSRPTAPGEKISGCHRHSVLHLARVLAKTAYMGFPGQNQANRPISHFRDRLVSYAVSCCVLLACMLTSCAPLPCDLPDSSLGFGCRQAARTDCAIETHHVCLKGAKDVQSPLPLAGLLLS